MKNNSNLGSASVSKLTNNKISEKFEKQLNRDIAKLKSQFLEFNAKYGNVVAGYTIMRMEGCSWSLWDIIVDAKSLRSAIKTKKKV